MAANLTPQYHQAEGRFRDAETPDDKLAALEEMWRELPKHKSTEKLQADLKKKLSAARKAIQLSHKKGPAKADPFCVPKSGAGQVVLLGAPNVGKSSIVGALTKAHVKIADYPFTTAMPLPGMVAYEDVKVELVDTPPVTADHVPAGFPGLWRSADALLVVVDAASDTVLEDAEMCLDHLADRNIRLCDHPPEPAAEPLPGREVHGSMLATKIDIPGATDNLELLRELVGSRVRIEPFSAKEESHLAHLPELLFELVDAVRVYAKPPGKKPDLDDPFILPAGSDIHALARKVHRGLEHQVRSARLWGHGVTDGQNVHLDHVLCDKDIVELHM